MASMETQKMMDLVTEKTGYGVSVIMASDIASWADMVSASEKNPRHLIRVNAKYARYGDYLVALQCAMLIIKWADPSHLPCFLVRESKTEKIINEVSKDHKLRNLPSAVRHQFSKMIVEGLLNQLQSAPTEMMAIEICYELCPGLRGVQEEAVEVNLREMTASLSTQIRDRSPSEVFRKNAAMNAAFCLEWAERSGDRTPVIPFETLGFLSKGQELLAAYRAVPVESRERYMLTVDSWAKILSLHGWYEWQFRDEVNKRGTDSL